MSPWSKTYWSLVWELTRTEFKLRDQGTFLGFLWTLLYPAMMFTVMYVVFVKWFGNHIPQYGPYLIIGIVQWQFFDRATTTGFSSLRRRAGLLRNFSFASEITVIAGAGSVFLSYLFEMAVLLILIRVWGVRFAPSWLALPLHMAALSVFTLATALILGLLSVEFQDMERTWSVLVTAGLYLTPVFYPLSVISPRFQPYMELNPMLHVIMGFRSCLLPDAAPYNARPAIILALSAAAVFAAIFAFQKRALAISDRIILP
ncbi:MAG: ABC transporter permease [Elusimicrobiota bacterium]